VVTNLDAAVLRQAIQGDEESFSRIVETYQRPVFNLCYRMLGQAQEAEDAAQETFWRAYQHLRRYDQQRPFATWLLSIAAHYCIDQQRKRRLPTLALELMPDEDAPDPAPNPERVFAQLEEKGQLQSLLARLGPQDRAAIILRYWYEFSEEEIAKTLQLTVSAVKSRLHRARKELSLSWESQSTASLAERRKNESPAL
jgi:RNA polymerase sigma-70 factor (ECF subfamily)